MNSFRGKEQGGIEAMKYGEACAESAETGLFDLPLAFLGRMSDDSQTPVRKLFGVQFDSIMLFGGTWWSTRLRFSD
jgi:hypothetical protein